MNQQQYILTKIAEEALEVAHRAVKAAQYGMHQTQPGKDQDNEERLLEEVKDLGIWLQVARENSVIKDPNGDVLMGRDVCHIYTARRLAEKRDMIVDCMQRAIDEDQLDMAIYIPLPLDAVL